MMQLLAFLLLPGACVAAGCATDLDCSLLGQCVGGICHCDEGWSGHDCAALALLPPVPIALPGSPPGAGSVGSAYVAPDGYSSWGMSVVRDVQGDGKYHGFVSQFKYGCDLDTWGTNSYVNHVVSDQPAGPWKQAGVALETWAHNPKVIWDPQEKTWVMYHIGTGKDPDKAVNCTKPSDTLWASERAASSAGATDTSPVSSSRPFQISYAKSVNGPWSSLSEVELGSSMHAGLGSTISSLFTEYPGVDNIGGEEKPTGGVELYEDPEHGDGMAYVSFANFSVNPVRKGALAWDSCGGPPLTFNNGHPIEIVGVGSAVGSMRVTGGDPGSINAPVAVLAASGCAVEYPGAAAALKPVGPYNSSSGKVALPSGINYLEIAHTGESGNSSVVKRVGVTEDPEGCRGACEVDDSCTSFTWRATADAGTQQQLSSRDSVVPRGPGQCYLRSDFLFMPNTTGTPNASVATASVVSGRPWSYDGDNPAPWIDPVSGNITVLYRCDSDGGSLYHADGSPNTYHTASLIGVATAPSWRGPYSSASEFGGPISNFQYPFDENEDPFLFKSKRGFVALFHANTWTDSRGNNIPVAIGAGRLAYSRDGRQWTYSSTPAYNGTIKFTNGSTLVLNRMERPVLLFDEKTGRPTHLINGVQPFTHPYTFTLIQQVAST